MSSYFSALGLALVLEIPVVALCFPGQRLRLAITCAVATTVTHFFMHFGLAPLVSSLAQFVVVGELQAVVLEAAAYWLASHPRSLKRALVASLCANGSSFVVGLLLF